jgi:hypothetical protein
MEAKYSIEKSFYKRITPSYIAEDGTLHNHRCENFNPTINNSSRNDLCAILCF